jgi:hypothetical protein
VVEVLVSDGALVNRDPQPRGRSPARRRNGARPQLRGDLRVDGDRGRWTLPVRPRVRRFPACAAVLLLAGCNLFSEPSPPEGSCTRDQDCPSPQRCYVDGCGTLPAELLAEVITLGARPASRAWTCRSDRRWRTCRSVLPAQQLVQLTSGAAAAPTRPACSCWPPDELAPPRGEPDGAVGRRGRERASSSSGSPPALHRGREPAGPPVPPATQTDVEMDAGMTSLTVDLLPAAQVQTVTGSVLAGPDSPSRAARRSSSWPPTDGRCPSGIVADAAGGFQLSFGHGTLAGGALLRSAPAGRAGAPSRRFPVSDPSRSGPLPGGRHRAAGRRVGTGARPGRHAGRGSERLHPGNGDRRWHGQRRPGLLRRRRDVSASPPCPRTLRVAPAVDRPTPGVHRRTGPDPGGRPRRITGRGQLDLPDTTGAERGDVAPRRGAAHRRARSGWIPVLPLDAVTPLPPAGASGQTGEAGTFALRLDPAVYQLEVAARGRLPVLRAWSG